MPFSFWFQPARKGRALAIGSAEIQNLKNTIYLLTVQKAPFNLCFLWNQIFFLHQHSLPEAATQGSNKNRFLSSGGYFN